MRPTAGDRSGDYRPLRICKLTEESIQSCLPDNAYVGISVRSIRGGPEKTDLAGKAFHSLPSGYSSGLASSEPLLSLYKGR